MSSCSAKVLEVPSCVDSLVRVNDTHLIAKVRGAGNYQGIHRVTLRKYIAAGISCSWQVVVDTRRLFHVLVGEGGELLLPQHVAVINTSSNFSEKELPSEDADVACEELCSQENLKRVVNFVAVALRAIWRAVEAMFDSDDLLMVLRHWLRLGDNLARLGRGPHTVLNAGDRVDRIRLRVLSRLSYAGRARRLLAFRAVARAVEGCYPGVEKISACDRLAELLLVRVHAVLYYGRPLLSDHLARRGGDRWFVRLAAGRSGWRRSWFNQSFWSATTQVNANASTSMDRASSSDSSGTSSVASESGTSSRKVLDVDGLQVQQLAPGIFSYPMFTTKFALQFAAAVRRFRQWTQKQGLPVVNDDPYLTALDEVGGEVFLDRRFVQRYVSPLVARLLPEAFDDGKLERSYAFARYYDAAQQTKGDGVHHDESTITVNVALSKTGGFYGGNLSFCGVFGFKDYRKHIFTLDWSQLPPGTAVLHLGLRRHAATPLVWGERMNLVLWALNAAPKGILSGPWETRQAPDPPCLSELYDGDYLQHRHLLKKDSTCT